MFLMKSEEKFLCSLAEMLKKKKKTESVRDRALRLFMGG